MYKKTFFKRTQSSTYTNLCNNYNNFAYTLAEVLIVLGIIGVVAAITIPTLVANYNEKQWNTAATVFDKKLEDTLKTMNTQQTLAGHASTESFVEKLSKHFKTNKICQNNELLDCFSDYIYWGGGEATPEKIDMSKIKFAKNFGHDYWDISLGFTFETSSYFAVWSREEYSAHQAYYRNFNPGSANLAHNSRGDIVRQAICIEE